VSDTLGAIHIAVDPHTGPTLRGQLGASTPP